ncbi:MAG TPA: hypothetical protein VG963_27910 [Polyangiaceae bacterium]|nr:hypothetical protein [Polyangiaceae bacterium]
MGGSFARAGAVAESGEAVQGLAMTKASPERIQRRELSAKLAPAAALLKQCGDEVSLRVPAGYPEDKREALIAEAGLVLALERLIAAHGDAPHTLRAIAKCVVSMAGDLPPEQIFEAMSGALMQEIEGRLTRQVMRGSAA